MQSIRQTNHVFAICLATILYMAGRTHAASGEIGQSFNPGEIIGIDNIVLQPDAKIIISGSFTNVGGVPRNRIARLNQDGNIDETFDPGTGADNEIAALALQTDGKILVGGNFTLINGARHNSVARLNSDGSVDSQFNPLLITPTWVLSVALQEDGKVLMGGIFRTVTGIIRPQLARLNEDGSVDQTFDAGKGPDRGVNSVKVQSDGKIVIGGIFVQVNAIPRPHVARLLSDGSLDTTFDPGTGLNDTLSTTLVQPDGKILVGGGFTKVNGVTGNHVCRLNSDGSLDTNFTSSLHAVGEVKALAVQKDGKVLVGGGFMITNNPTRYMLARLNSDGTIDSSFKGSIENAYRINSIVIRDDTHLLVGGNFRTINGETRAGMAELLVDAIAISPIPLEIEKLGENVILTWSDSLFSLEIAPEPHGPYAMVLGATTPYTNNIGQTQQYFRLVAP